MAQTITLELPDETLQRYRRGATAARKLLEEFLIERLVEAVPPLADNLPSPDILAAEIVEKLETALAEFAEIARTLSPASSLDMTETVSSTKSET